MIRIVHNETQRLAQMVQDISHNKLGLTVAKRGLGAMLRKLQEEINDTGTHQFHLNLVDLPERFNLEIEKKMLTTVREMITNTRKHARAEHIYLEVGIRHEEELFYLDYKDDGVGLPEDMQSEPGGGFLTFAMRAQIMEGTFEVCPGDGGIHLRMEIPLP